MIITNEFTSKEARNAKDFMIYPQLVNDPFRDKGMSYAQDLKAYIDYAMEMDELINDPEVIY